jgi:hypothetical protein
MICKEEEEDAKLRERRGGMATGSLVLGIAGRNLLVERGGGGDSDGNGKGGGMEEKLVDCPTCGQKETRGIIETMLRRGEDNPRTILAFEIFLLSRILSSAKNSP